MTAEPLAGDLRRYLIGHVYSSRPLGEGAHWVMNAEWWDECRRLIYEPALLADLGSDRGLHLLGLPVTVTDDGGVPHLEHPAAAAAG